MEVRSPNVFSQRYPRTTGYFRLVFSFLIVICAMVGANRLMLNLVGTEMAGLIAVFFGVMIIGDRS